MIDSGWALSKAPWISKQRSRYFTYGGYLTLAKKLKNIQRIQRKNIQIFYARWVLKSIRTAGAQYSPKNRAEENLRRSVLDLHQKAVAPFYFMQLFVWSEAILTLFWPFFTFRHKMGTHFGHPYKKLILLWECPLFLSLCLSVTGLRARRLDRSLPKFAWGVLFFNGEWHRGVKFFIRVPKMVALFMAKNEKWLFF